MTGIMLVLLAIIACASATIETRVYENSNYARRVCDLFVLSEYDATSTSGRAPSTGALVQIAAASPYYYANWMEAYSRPEDTFSKFKMSGGSDYLSRAQIPTSNDLQRINPAAFQVTDIVSVDPIFHNYSIGYPFLSSTNWGDGQSRYYSAVADLPTTGGRVATNWARSKEWNTEFPDEKYSGSSVSVKCPELWSFTRGTTHIDGSEFDYGFGTGNPMTIGADKYVYAEPTTTWIGDLSDVYVDGHVEINLYHDLGESTLTITDTLTGVATTFGPDPNGGSVATWIASGLKFTAVLNSVDSDVEDAGVGFRASYDVIEPTTTNSCFVSSLNNCNKTCYRTTVCLGFADVSLFNVGFDSMSCCTGNWTARCALAADAVYWSRVCTPSGDVNEPYYDVEGLDTKRTVIHEEDIVPQVLAIFPGYTSLNQLQKIQISSADYLGRSDKRSEGTPIQSASL